ncbi:MAG: hypothetical protein PHC48_08165 [Prevotella sp.]|nr:hypothetical protein [Prevotella sp.]MDT3388087.1 hypothetical protein [Bacteroidota bacterium]
MHKILFPLAVLLFVCTPIAAQNNETDTIRSFKNLDVSVSAGSTGLGLDLSSKISSMFRLRAGFSFMPHWIDDMKFSVQVGDKAESKYDAQGNRIETKFDRLQTRMKELTGFEVDETIHLEGKPKYYNFSLLLDVMPLVNKHWYVTGGFFWGNEKIADAIVSRDDMTTMLAVGMYNNMYTKAMNNQPFVTVNGNDIYNDALAEKLTRYGRMKYSIGDMKATGEPCYVEPDESGLIKAVAIANKLKPYIGVGYDGRLGRAEEGWKIGFDAGVLFYGGVPHIYTDRTIENVTTDEITGEKHYTFTKKRVDMARDVINYKKNIKTKMSIIKAMPVFPVLNVKITKTIF